MPVIFLLAQRTTLTMSSGEKPPQGLTIDRAAFLLLRVKRAFKKKKQQRKERSTTSGECKSDIKSSSRATSGTNGGGCCRPAPLLRSSTLPAIVAPGLSILQKQIDARYAMACGTAASGPGRGSFNAAGFNEQTERIEAGVKSTKLLTPRIFCTDETLAGERRVSESVIEAHRKGSRSGEHVSSRTSGRLSSSSVLSTSQPLTRLARLLNQRPSYIPSDNITRRLSWERRGDGNGNHIEDFPSSHFTVPRSTSIDSLACANWSYFSTGPISSALGGDGLSYDIRRDSGYDFTSEAFSPLPYRKIASPCPSPTASQTTTPLLHVRGERQSISSNIGRRIKGQRAIVALFTAIEQGQLDKAKTILESADIDVNCVNSDGLTPLDVAVLDNNKSLIKMLVAYGAKEGNQFKSPECLGSHLASLLLSAEHRLNEVGGTDGALGTSSTSFLDATSARASFSTAHNNLTGCGGNTEDKQVALWERRVRTLRKMLLGFDQARPPDAPFMASIDVIGTKSVSIRFQETETQDSYVCSKFRVQWSTKEDFSIIIGEREVFDMKQRECRIDGLIQGQRYYFRACAGNLKGYSRFIISSPCSVIPSSWRDVDGKQPRFAGRLEQLDSLFTDIKRPEYTQDTPALQRRNHKKKTTIKQLFTATSKFQKSLRRGVYLACVLYHEDKVLVTNEDFLPVIEVDETYPSCIHNDYHWLMKVACTWDDVKILKQDMEKSHSSSTNHFRLKLLQAAAQMQTALCIQDLGQVYHKPIRDVQGTLVLSTINFIKSPKLVSLLNSRWLPLSKVKRKITIHEDSNVADILMASIKDQMTYHQLSSVKLSKGLYLGYLKMQSSVDLIQIVVPSKAPNFLPHCKVRDNPHVSAEEWEYLKKITRIQARCDDKSKDKERGEEKENDYDYDNDSEWSKNQGNEQQKLFVDLVSATARRLFSYMEVNSDDSLIHRLYDAEVIELTDEVSFLIVVPPAETACSVPGTREILLQRDDLLSLPIQIFEMVHLNTYQKDVVNRYCRLSCILELDTAQAQHSHREAFSSIEVSVAKDKLSRLEQLQTQMNAIWKGARWLIDVITFARARGSSQYAGLMTSNPNSALTLLTTTAGISMRYLLNIERCHNKTNGLKRSLLQLPPRDLKLVKSSPGRGSWPGPNISNSATNLLTTEFSKSEQQLPCGGHTTEGQVNNQTAFIRHEEALTPSIIDERHSRKGSDTSNYSTVSEPVRSNHPSYHTSASALAIRDGANIKLLPPSKSEDTLLLSQYRHISKSCESTQSTVSMTVSVSTSPQLVSKPMYGNTLAGSTNQVGLANTTSLLSVNTATSNANSTNSLNSLNDDYSGEQSMSIVRIKSKSSKPSASVASVASCSLPNSNQSNNVENKDQTSMAMPAPLPGILQVYAAYETGLAAGTSLKLHVTPRTTAREVVDLVVKQLNMAVVLKGQQGPIYVNEELPNFCLVAVIGARERCLRDDFKPLQLQNPWKKGRLYVRLKQDVLAALEHSSKHTAYL
ncbi:uncharacterized protein wake isoform X2 [Fopius arisanus]|uniref:ANKFN1_0 protein n=1 Tax=Fopius arisanus TaxID=64838 RepID=A0A0C9R7V9_9HYME|nr:PREDICTED: uncharacterized protein LOC105265133 isoform X2 [Fopius arisanus]